MCKPYPLPNERAGGSIVPGAGLARVQAGHEYVIVLVRCDARPLLAAGLTALVVAAPSG